MATKTTASTYDPALGGTNGNPNSGGCGVPSKELPWSIAHKHAPCGSVVTITRSDGKEPIIQTVVADRGPYVNGRDLDLRPAVADAIGSSGLIQVEYAVSVKHHVNLREYAKKGGNQAAFESMTGLVASSSDTRGQQADTQYQADHAGNPVSTVTDALGTMSSAVVKVLGALVDPSTYLRLGKGLLGGVLIIVGTGALVFIIANRVSNTPTGRTVKKAAEAAAL